MKIKLIVLLILVCSSSFAADIPKLKKLFKEEFNSLYQPRFCGRNIEAFLKLAKEKNIDLSNSKVLKIVGGGFLETSAFYSREKIDERVMIGYFHMVLVADGYVFDFDLNKAKVLKLKPYFRLQFTPAYEPYTVWGIDYSKNGNPRNWTVTSFNSDLYGQGLEHKIDEQKLYEVINIKSMRSIDRSSLY